MDQGLTGDAPDSPSSHNSHARPLDLSDLFNEFQIPVPPESTHISTTPPPIIPGFYGVLGSHFGTPRHHQPSESANLSNTSSLSGALGLPLLRGLPDEGGLPSDAGWVAQQRLFRAGANDQPTLLPPENPLPTHSPLAFQQPLYPTPPSYYRARSHRQEPQSDDGDGAEPSNARRVRQRRMLPGTEASENPLPAYPPHAFQHPPHPAPSSHHRAHNYRRHRPMLSGMGARDQPTRLLFDNLPPTHQPHTFQQPSYPGPSSYHARSYQQPQPTASSSSSSFNHPMQYHQHQGAALEDELEYDGSEFAPYAQQRLTSHPEEGHHQANPPQPHHGEMVPSPPSLVTAGRPWAEYCSVPKGAAPQRKPKAKGRGGGRGNARARVDGEGGGRAGEVGDGDSTDSGGGSQEGADQAFDSREAKKAAQSRAIRMLNQQASMDPVRKAAVDQIHRQAQASIHADLILQTLPTYYPDTTNPSLLGRMDDTWSLTDPESKAGIPNPCKCAFALCSGAVALSFLF
jgi:hypothetical protein